MKHRPGRISTLLMALVATLAIGAGAGAVAYSTFSSPDTTTIVRVPVGNSEPTAVHISRSRSARSTGAPTRASSRSRSRPRPRARSAGQSLSGRRARASSTTRTATSSRTSTSSTARGRSPSASGTATSHKATVVGSDPSTDLAVIKVDAPQSILSPLAVGDSAKVLVGDGVVAIGSPFGLEETVTSGIVSALHRQMQAPNGFTINDSIQTDAAINHGNSGGPLLNSEGEVIGVNAQIRSDGGGSDGVGFAIPSNTITAIATQLIDERQGGARLPRRVRSDDPRVGRVGPRARRGRRARQGDERHSRPPRQGCTDRPARSKSMAMPIRPEATCSPRSTDKRSQRPRSSSARSTRSTPATRSRSRTGGTARATRPM